ncbi:hypothetical protein CWS72_07935 [Telmatospirillum siberiense]|uniref:Uncharacterized protein n=1 Tax=Telmatospirillum siberiense TaxID=382514 RepID=A0A2N3PXI8_9PROT|nr:hypothetical protein CWS72_07935 [Telmatospirillum siberiense]
MESGSPEGNYRKVHKDGRALGAYQMRTPALRQIEALDPDGDIDNPADWTGKFGADKDDFLGDDSIQDDAAIAYMNWIGKKSPLAPILKEIDEHPGAVSDGIPVTVTGVLLAAWKRQDQAIGGAKGRSVESDILDRFEVGAILEGREEDIEGELREKALRICDLLQDYAETRDQDDHDADEFGEESWRRWSDHVPKVEDSWENWPRFLEQDGDDASTDNCDCPEADPPCKPSDDEE